MAGIFSKIFGTGKKSSKEESDIETLISDTMEGIIEISKFDFSFSVRKSEEDGEPTLFIELSGNDNDMLKDREGQLIDAFQLYLKRVVQHRFPEDKTNIIVDCDGYKEESSQALVDLAEKLKSIAIEKGKSVYFRALPPKDRKIIHQYLADDGRVKSRSIGDGLYKKIKIYPIKGQNSQVEDDAKE